MSAKERAIATTLTVALGGLAATTLVLARPVPGSKFSGVGSAISGDASCGPACERAENAGGSRHDLSSPGAAPTPPAPPVSPTAPAPASNTPDAAAPRPGVLAGSVDDNEHWEDYLRYLQTFDREQPRAPVHRVAVDGRVVITVVDSEGRAVFGARVSVVDASGVTVVTLRTFADGRTVFFAPTAADPNTQGLSAFVLVAEKDGRSGRADLEGGGKAIGITLDGPVAPTSTVKLDVLFLLDATGSMGDEIDRLKANISSIASNVSSLPARPDLRFGMTLYRDRGDAFTIRTVDLTPDVSAFGESLANVRADGGGDIPEDLSAGLHEALTTPAWRGADTLKLVILVADAPPHIDYDGPRYIDDLGVAAQMGVKVFPVGASGLDPTGEYVFRQIGQMTMAPFVFLTYGADGASPGDRTTAHVDREDYEVLPLDELVTRLVSNEVTRLAAR